ncbi:MAG: HD domain-containing protein [Bacteroidia bacterium]|nr:HD domain-containing protein [Bacteroidia bacterium]NNF30514.1 HD domain-containing protein [Flavobacteriaceae bacterium]NNK53838.1 HD domain-containing protein [Flavobacteriaceae bacterium]
MTSLVEKASKYVQQLLQEELPGNCLYHNFTHTRRVFKSTKEIIENSAISEEDTEIILLTALFHDTGFVKCNDGHEAESVNIATAFLKEHEFADDKLEKVAQCIMATQMEASPETKLDEIIRDADASHFAKDYFQEASEFLRLELKLKGLAEYSKTKWLAGNIDLLRNTHTYYTDYAKKHWNPKKEENILTMEAQQKELKGEKKVKEKKLKAKLKSVDPEKAIQSVFRVTLRNHIKLSDIADTKANILLSVNAIIISIALSNLIPKLDNPSNSYLIVPTIIFLLFTVTSIVLSVLATRPNVTSGKFTKEDVNNKKVNLLFFGNFHQMSLDEFNWAMTEMLNDKDYIYSSLTKDLYFLGLVLQKKYKILRLTYSIFMTGIIVSVVAFAIAFMTI